MLAQLRTKYPLPPGWSSFEPFYESVEIGGSSIDLAGVSAVGPRGEQVTGSAGSAGTSHPCIARSYFELLERISVVTAIGDKETGYLLRDRSGRSVGQALRKDVFWESPCPDRWRPSLSNGVALHESWQEACDRAEAELVERDRLLRSWYGESGSVRLTLPQGAVAEGMQSLAEWRAYELTPTPAGVGKAFAVVVVVALPKVDTTPLAYGFAARTNRAEAIKAAASEAVQRFGFLVGEEIPQASPPFSPTPDFHQEFFLHPPAHALLQEWLDCTALGQSAARSEAEGQRASRVADEATRFVDLTPPQLRGSLFVAKALCSKAEPLVFGEPAPHRGCVRAGRRVHPVA
jgi:hypothetical protein